MGRAIGGKSGAWKSGTHVTGPAWSHPLVYALLAHSPYPPFHATYNVKHLILTTSRHLVELKLTASSLRFQTWLRKQLVSEHHAETIHSLQIRPLLHSLQMYVIRVVTAYLSSTAA